MYIKYSILFLVLCKVSAFGQINNDFVNIDRILQRFTQNYGALGDSDKLSSVSVEGVIEQNNQVYTFRMRRKRPNLYYYSLSAVGNKVIIAFDGSTAWKQTELNGVTSVENIRMQSERVLLKSAIFDSPLYRYLENYDINYKSVGRDIIDGSITEIIAVKYLDGSSNYYYLDLNTAYVMRRDDINNVGENVLQTYFFNYKEVGGFPFAHKIETRMDTVVNSTAKITSIKVNEGLLNFIFEKPR